MLALLVAAASEAAADDPTHPPIAPFSAAKAGASLPAPWRIARMPGAERATRYALVADGDAVVLQAQADASMASVVHPLHLDPASHPLIAWRWKTSNTLRKSELGRKSGDDFPARVYVFFDYDIGKLSLLQQAKIRLARLRYGEDVPAAALCYVWDGKAPAGTSAWSPYTDRVRVIVVESGDANIDRWQAVERDVVADFREAFGEAPPPISGVAVASDTDNTGESVTTLFGDIRLRAR